MIRDDVERGRSKAKKGVWRMRIGILNDAESDNQVSESEAGRSAVKTILSEILELIFPAHFSTGIVCEG